MKNIAFMLYSLGSGGIERLFADLSVALAACGYQIYFFVIDDQTPAYEISGSIHKIGFTDTKKRWWTPLMAWQHLDGAARLKKKLAIDVTISAWEYLNLINLLTGREQKIPTLHNYRFQSEITPGMKDGLIEYCFQKLSGRANPLVCVSKGIADKAAKRYRGDIITIYNGLNCRQIDEMMVHKPVEGRLWEVKEGSFTFFAAGRLVKQKNFKNLILAFGRILAINPQANLVIAGEGPERTALAGLAGETAPAGRISLPGSISNPFYYMRQCDVFVLSSAYEGFGQVITEALYAEAAIVATDCLCGPGEILAPAAPLPGELCREQKVYRGEYGLLVENHNVTALFEGMRLMMEDQQLRLQYKSKARKRGKDFDMASVLPEWLRLIG